MNQDTTSDAVEAAAPAAAAPSHATLSIKLVRSIAGTRESHRATIRGLGLRKIGSESTLEDTPSVRGMINKVRYLVKVL